MPEKPPPPRAPTEAEKRQERDRAEADALIEDILERVSAADAVRRSETWAGMPLAEDSEPPKVTDEARRLAWAKHGLTPPAHRKRFDVYGHALN